MNEELETLDVTPGFSLLLTGEGLGMRACKVEQTIASKVAEILEAI
jgi:hypothetical protein